MPFQSRVERHKVNTEYLDDRGVAELYEITPRHLRELRRRRAIPYTKIGRLVRYSRVELDKWAAQHTIQAR